MAQIGTDLNLAAQFLESGNVVAIPTETVYGLAANALDENAVLKIFKVKNRPAFDPLIVHTPNIEGVEKIATNIPETFYKLAKSLCPGPITFILKKKDIIPGLVTSGNNTVGVRIPKHPLTLKLLNKLQFPLAAPSANPFGFVSPTNAQHVNNQLGPKIPYIIDGGQCVVGIESTIIDLTHALPVVLRLGGLKLDAIERILGEPITQIKTSSSNPKAPGMLSSHYSPGCPIYMGDLNELVKNSKFKNIGVLDFNGSLNTPKTCTVFDLSTKGNIDEAAQNLFKGLRYFSEGKVDVVYTQLLPNIGLGAAINDRLTRAAATVV